MENLGTIRVGDILEQEQLEKSGWRSGNYFGNCLIFSHEATSKMLLWDPVTCKITHIIPSEGRYATTGMP